MHRPWGQRAGRGAGEKQAVLQLTLGPVLSPCEKLHLPSRERQGAHRGGEGTDRRTNIES